jgi:hypothetical protein
LDLLDPELPLRPPDRVLRAHTLDPRRGVGRLGPEGFVPVPNPVRLAEAFDVPHRAVPGESLAALQLDLGYTEIAFP